MIGLGTCRGGQYCTKKKSRLQLFPEQGETLDIVIAGALLTEYINEIGGDAQSSPPKRSSPGSWSGNSSLNQSGRAASKPPSHNLEHDDNAGDEQFPTASSYPTEMEMDNLAAALQYLSGEVVRDKPPSLSAGAQPLLDARAIQDDDAGMDIVDEKAKEKVEEKKKEPVFFMGLELVDLDDCDDFDMKLQYERNDMDDDDAPKPEGMDVSNSGASSLQCLEPNTDPSVEPLQSSVRV